MRDAIGNKISEGDLVKWALTLDLASQLVWTVSRVSDGGVATPDGPTPPIIQLTITLPITTQDSAEPRMEAFVCVRNPRSEAILDRLTGGAKQ